MNIFWLDWNPEECAKAYSDKHVIKIILEIVQMLYTVHHELDQTTFEDGYRPTHKQHPMTRWVGECQGNYIHVISLGIALCDEYSFRFKGRVHKCRAHLERLQICFPKNWNAWPISLKRKRNEISATFFASDNIPLHLTPIPLCMPSQYYHSNPIQAYKQYYCSSQKMAIHVWKNNRPPPVWINHALDLHKKMKTMS